MPVDLPHVVWQPERTRGKILCERTIERGHRLMEGHLPPHLTAILERDVMGYGWLMANTMPTHWLAASPAAISSSILLVDLYNGRVVAL